MRVFAAKTKNKSLKFLVLALGVSLAGCRYTEPRWHLTAHQVVVNRDTRTFVVAVTSTLAREPKGFVSQFPDGGSWVVLQEKISVWRFEVETLAFDRIAEIKRPSEIDSGLSFHCEGWDESGDFYITVRGQTGSTSDTPSVKHYFRIRSDNQITEVSVLPDTRASVETGALADLHLLVDIDQPPNQGLVSVGISKNYLIPYKTVFAIRLDGTVEKASR